MDLLTMSLSAAVMIAAIVILRALLIDRLPKTTFLILGCGAAAAAGAGVGAVGVERLLPAAAKAAIHPDSAGGEHCFTPGGAGGFTAFGHHN